MNDKFDFGLLLRRKWLIMLSGLVAACLAVAMTKVMPREYAADGGMIVENSEPNVPELGVGVGSSGGNNDGVVLTQLEVLRSRGLINQVVLDHHLVDAPDLKPALRLPLAVQHFLAMMHGYLAAATAVFAASSGNGSERSPVDQAADYIGKHLKVAATDHSSVISLRFLAGSPVRATEVINAVMDVYLANDIARRKVQITQVNNWLTERAASLEKDANNAEHVVTDFISRHNHPEVQGSLTAAIQLSKDQEKLAVAQQKLANQEAVLKATLHGGGAGAEETLESKTIQFYKDRESQVRQQLASMTQIDPRRVAFERILSDMQAQVTLEIQRIVDATRYKVDIDQANVKATEAAVDRDLGQAQSSSVDAATLLTLRHDADAKHQLYLAFGTRTQQTMLAAAGLPSARILFKADLEPATSFMKMALLFGFVAGALLSSALLILRESFSTKINSTIKMAIATGLPVFGSLPAVKKPRELIAAPATSMVGETLRAIWLKIRPPSGEDLATTVLVTSSDVGEGKTTIAAALAHRIAEDGYRVLLIDGDLRRHRLAAALRQRPTRFLDGILSGSVTLQDAVIRDPFSGVDLLFSDGSTSNPMAALSSAAFSILLMDARREYNFVVLDSPPVLRVADTMIMAELCQHILFIVRSNYLASGLISEATRRFAETDRLKIFTLLTGVRPNHLQRGDYFGGYLPAPA
ncbi:GumC family protein [Rhodopila sp.]|uniref:GumC family protein n=1 Tax=Rhodopila sp. TaxID=2480087 RepID=UPI003D0DD27D